MLPGQLYPVRQTPVRRKPKPQESTVSVRIEITASLSDDDWEAVFSGLRAYNRAQGDYGVEPLAVLVREPDGRVAGGLVGRTGSWLSVELLWLPEGKRGAGLGTEVMRAAEAEAVRRGCLGAHLDTFSFQAPGFYRRLGYEVFGVIDDYPPGHKRYYLRKRFASFDDRAHG
jgi:ribosomal protein S18 acetylase RimI-like enzyme